MDAVSQLSEPERLSVDALVEFYTANLQVRAGRLAEALLTLANTSNLLTLVHSVKARAKDPSHLRDKLARKIIKSKSGGPAFDISTENLSERINDLAGLRILHLHTSQFPAINTELMRLLEQEEYEVREGPVARTWDDEYRDIFRGYGVATESNSRLYTSVHYVVGSGKKLTAEIQVRTLAEELWGEVDHTINYPHPSEVKTCQEQIKVLARVTSSATRLVDSIFLAKRDADGSIKNVGQEKMPLAKE